MATYDLIALAVSTNAQVEQADMSVWLTYGPLLAAVILSPLTAWLTFHLVKKRELAASLRLEIDRLELVRKPELAESLRYELQLQTELAALAEDTNRRERVRKETLRWATPILSTVDDLRGRLDNILNKAGHVVLSPTWRHTGQWSITHEHFLTSTVYLFAAYFAYTEQLRQTLSFELFRSQEDKDKLFQALHSVASTLSAFPAPWGGRNGARDSQVFRMQQRALGELMIVERSGEPACLRFPDFLGRSSDPDFAMHVEPVRELVESLTPADTDGRWQRLQHTLKALNSLSLVCRDILDLDQAQRTPASAAGGVELR